MDKTLHDLGGIVLEGLPSFLLILILAFFVKHLYLDPLEKVLAERFRLTEGARKAAEDSLKNAGTRIAEYEEALNRARDEIYKEQAEFLRKVHTGQAEQAHEVRTDAERQVAEMKLSLAQEAEAALGHLAAQSDLLAGQIADAILLRRAA